MPSNEKITSASHLLLRVTAVDKAQTKKGRNYKVISYEELTTIDGNRLLPTGKKGRRTLWLQENIASGPYGNKPISKTHPKNHIYNTIKIGDLFSGKIVDVQTNEQIQEEGNLFSFPSVIFDNEDNVLRITAKEMKYLGYSAKPCNEKNIPYTYIPYSQNNQANLLVAEDEDYPPYIDEDDLPF